MIPLTVTVGALATADDDGISVSQTAPGAFNLSIGGALSAGFSATNIAAAQAVAGAGNLTLDGTLVNGGIAQLGSPSYVAITSAGDDTGITFTVKGLLYGPGGNGGSYQSETLTGSNTSVVVTTKKFSVVTAITASAAAAGNVSAGVNGTASLDMGRRVIVTSAGNDSAKSFTVAGTDWNNNPISQTITGANAGIATTTVDFKTVTAITCSAATASTVKVGTNGVADSRPILLDQFNFAPWTLQTKVTGTVNYTVSFSLDNPSDVGLANMTWFDCTDTAFVAATASKYGGFANAPQSLRMTLNSGTGSVKLTAIQNANVPA